jgi:hypothetical protein
MTEERVRSLLQDERAYVLRRTYQDIRQVRPGILRVPGRWTPQTRAALASVWLSEHCPGATVWRVGRTLVYYGGDRRC